MNNNHMPQLDGIRGLLSMWVFWGHIAVRVGAGIPILRETGFAVDLFMLLSGFLMSYHWLLANDLNPAKLNERTKNFWIRRFFRVAPLYYFLYIFALWLTPNFQVWGGNLSLSFPHPWAAQLEKFVPLTNHEFSFANVLSHVTFVFGAIPQFVNNNAIPDWSLSLEMQFYLLLPFLVHFTRRSRLLPFILIASGIAFVMSKLFGLYLEPGLLGNFPQPSFIPFKIHVFAAGMALGCLVSMRGDRSNDTIASYYLAYAIPLLLLPKIVAILAILFAALVSVQTGPIKAVNQFLATRIFKFLGDISYSLYLVHLLLSIPVLNLLLEWGFFVQVNPYVRFFLAIGITTPIVFCVAYVLHRVIEIPGINLGKRITSKAVQPVVAV